MKIHENKKRTRDFSGKWSSLWLYWLRDDYFHLSHAHYSCQVLFFIFNKYYKKNSHQTPFIAYNEQLISFPRGCRTRKISAVAAFCYPLSPNDSFPTCRDFTGAGAPKKPLTVSLSVNFSANIASALTSANYGLIFGWNTFVAVALQTILTLAVADSHGWNLPIRKQVSPQ